MSKFPPSAYVDIPAPVASDDAPTFPAEVSFGDYLAALEPLLRLIGTDSDSIFAEAFRVTPDEVEFVSVVPVSGVTPIEVGDDPEWACWGWPVSVPVNRP